MTIKPLGAITATLEVPIRASRETVWRALTEEVGNWWREDFFATKGRQTLTMEPHVGGRLYETNSEGAELLWYTVIALEPAVGLTLSGQIAPPWGGPATSLLSFRLEDSDDGTVLTLQDNIFGVVDEKHERSMNEGWKLLIEEALKEYAEGLDS